VCLCLAVFPLALASLYLVTSAHSGSPEEQVCRRFMALKNAGDPQAEALLAPRPRVPDTAVSEAEADRLDADIMLHQDYRIRDLVPLGGGLLSRFVLVVEGSVTSERILVRTPTGTDANQRSMWSPDLIVEVRDGKIHGVRARLHEDSPATP
jgi:hypothetical protein